jgi:very-short-patch-repair endonuclease
MRAMAPITSQRSGAAVWKLAKMQHGVVTTVQLRALGFSTEAIAHRLAKGRLHRVGRGVYAVGRPELTQHGRWMAAVLRCGAGAVLSHDSAAALWEIRRARPGDIEVLTRAGGTRRAGLRVHRRATLTADEVTGRHGIPVTTVVCTVIDLAARLPRDELEAAINEADQRGLTNPPRLRAALDRAPRRPGVGALRETLDRRTFRFTRSRLERWFRPIARRAGLPQPQTRCWVNGFEVDFYWPELGLVIETDGLTYHRTPAQQAEDRLRDQAHTVAGLTPLRFTHGQIRFEPSYVEATLSAVARRLEAARGNRR